MTNKEFGVTQISRGQVKQIATQIQKRWTLVNRGSYYNVIDKTTGQCSIQGGDNNLVSYQMYCKIEHIYLKMIGENPLYFDWMKYGVDISNNRKNYVFKIQDEIVRLSCGFQTKINTLNIGA